jgi:predicted N-formylglutamate amidohydrolase
MSRAPALDELLLTCEHGGNRVPREYAGLFAGATEVLDSHRGWDLGALPLARLLEQQLRRPLYSTTWSRLLVEANRSPTNRKIWSQFTADLPKQDRDRILERWWRPHREEVEAAMAAATKRGQVVHVAVHSFTPVMNGEARNADVGLLYDSRRKREGEFCARWLAALRRADSSVRVRCNYPYLGKADGLATALRKRYPQSRYIGVELEINQARVGAPGWKRFQQRVVDSLREALS